MKSSYFLNTCISLTLGLTAALTHSSSHQRQSKQRAKTVFSGPFLASETPRADGLLTTILKKHKLSLDAHRSNTTINETCLLTKQVQENDIQGKQCPTTCPLYVQDKTDDQFCSFRCVPATIESCSFYNPNAPVPDLELGVCRSCRVRGCSMCTNDGTDTCIVCKEGYQLVDGTCYDHRRFMWYMALSILGVLVLIIAAWFINLACRQITNPAGLERGLDTRSAAKLHKPREEKDTKRNLWSIHTDLRETPVAGLGVMHMFNFEFVLILWAAGVVIAWIFLAVFVDMDFLTLGIKDPGKTPRDHCITVQWGFTTQQRLMSVKIVFVFVLYIVSFLLAIVYSIYELRKHHRMDSVRVSHKDFCAKCIGLPCLSGEPVVDEDAKVGESSSIISWSFSQSRHDKSHLQVEDTIKVAIANATGQEPLGVSIAWDYKEEEDFFMEVIDYDYENRMAEEMGDNIEIIQRSAVARQTEEEERMHWLTRIFVNWEKEVQRIMMNRAYEAHPAEKSAIRRRSSVDSKCFNERDEQTTKSASGDLEVCQKLRKLKTTGEAFIVFDTEEARDKAITKSQELVGINYKYRDDDGERMTAKLTLVEVDDEPQSVNWTNFGNDTHFLVNLLLGLLCILCALLVWCCCFYLPYAYSVLRADYAHGTDPNLFARTMFGFIVVAGNAVMYLVCAEVSDRIGFKTRSEREVCYMLLYTFACVFNVLLDLGMSYHMAYKQMVGLGMKTYDGKHLAHVDSFSERFETYAMQKSLGGLLLDYAFPSTFLIPFLIEPIVTVYLPYRVMRLIVSTHPAIFGPAADALLASTPMDLSRYADVLLNLMLAALVFFFPGGYVLYMFVGLIVSHLFIYAYDHWRVLRSIPDCDFATFDVEWWSQWMLSIPCGILLACAMFKSQCRETVQCWNDHEHIIERCGLLFFAHIAVHTMVLLYFVPICGGKTKLEEAKHKEKYETCAKRFPSSFFSANPVHCLRSQYIYQHSPPFHYYIPGKDYLLQENAKIHAYYTVERPDSEEYTVIRKTHVRRAMSDIKHKVGGWMHRGDQDGTESSPSSHKTV